MHFSHNENPLQLYFSTESTGKKVQGLLKGEVGKGSVVLGFSEEEFVTLQMDGEVAAILDSLELKKAKDIHYSKIPTAKKYENEPETLFVKFIPKWWRYTDYKTNPLTIGNIRNSLLGGKYM